MSIVRFDPIRDLADFSTDINRLFVRTFGESGAARSWSPAIDVFEREDAVVVKAELPGLTVADVDVEIDDTASSAATARSVAASPCRKASRATRFRRGLPTACSR
jgi:HSP20 family protein